MRWKIVIHFEVNSTAIILRQSSKIPLWDYHYVTKCLYNIHSSNVPELTDDELYIKWAGNVNDNNVALIRITNNTNKEAIFGVISNIISNWDDSEVIENIPEIIIQKIKSVKWCAIIR